MHRLSKQIFVVLLTGFLTHQVSGQFSFQHLIGGTGQERGQTLFPTRGNGYIYNGATLTYGAGSADAYFVRTDLQGQITWARAYGTAFYDNSEFAMPAYNDELLGTGRTFYPANANSNALLFKTDSSGHLLWSKTYGGAGNDITVHMIETSDHGYALVGGTQSIGAGSDDILLIRTDVNGDTIFTKSYGTAVSEFGTSVIQAADGGFFISGKQTIIRNGASYADGILMRTDPLGNLRWAKLYGDTLWDELNSVRITADGGLISCGTSVSFSVGSYDILVVRTDSSGNVVWAKNYGGVQSDASYGLLVNDDSTYVISGYTNSMGYGHQARLASTIQLPGPGYTEPAWKTNIPFGDDSTNIILMKIDASGDTAWTRTYGDGLQDEAYRNEKANDGGYLVAGLTTDYAFADSSQMIFIKTDSLGMTGCHELTSHPQVETALITGQPVVFSESSGLTTGTVPLIEFNTTPDDQDACLYLAINSAPASTELMVSPNPVSGLVNLSFSGKINFERWIITDITGRIIQTGEIFSRDTQREISMDLSFLYSGIYCISFVDHDFNSNTIKIVKL